jgi:mono/diheme cytochrome c family protein
MRRGWLVRSVVALAIGLLGGSVLFAVVALRPVIPPELSQQLAPDRTLIAKGAQLAAIGNCNVCHTRLDGPPFAGGRSIATPFGRVYATNITPDPDTGIGGWSEAAFERAMREGVSRDGHHLYPAFPYDHMAKMSEDDIRAVYAFIMTRRPVHASTPANELAFPFNVRMLVAGWKLLFLARGELRPDRAQSAEWNRGAYLVEGLGHCGACHTPRNALGAERREQAYAGGEADGWIAPALNAASPAAVPWDTERLYTYLRHGEESLHGSAAGPMAPVVSNLAGVPDADVRAIATYVASVAGAPTRERQTDAEKVMARAKSPPAAAAGSPGSVGAAIYAGTCAQCHGEAGRAPANAALNLSLSSALRVPRPDNILRILRGGIRPDGDGRGPFMPGFAGVLTEAQTVALLGYLRSHFADKPAWAGVEEAVRRAAQNQLDTSRSIREAQRQP